MVGGQAWLLLLFVSLGLHLLPALGSPVGVSSWGLGPEEMGLLREAKAASAAVQRPLGWTQMLVPFLSLPRCTLTVSSSGLVDT